MDTIKLQKAVHLLNILDSTGWVQMTIDYIQSNPGKTVGQLHDVFGLKEKSDTSGRLKKLVSEDLVYYEKKKRFHHYYVNQEKINKIQGALDKFLGKTDLEYILPPPRSIWD